MENDKKMSRCPNFNHFKSNILVRYCCDCGDTLNAEIGKKKCEKAAHLARLKDRSRFCVDCGENLQNQ